jgi:hypothetical protein
MASDCRPVVSAVALMDALGFREIWQRHDPGEVVAAISRVRSDASSMKDWSDKGGLHDFRLGRAPRLHVGWFSDTLYIVAQGPIVGGPPPEENRQKQLLEVLVDVVVKAVGTCIQHAAEGPVPIAFRGVVTVGDAVATDDNIYLGPAINEAAELYERAEGAFVWLSPAASRFADDDLQSAVVTYPVPLKGGQTLDTWVCSPFINTVPRSNAGGPIRRGIENAMAGDRPDVVVKRQNTMRFLDHIADTDPAPVERFHD